MPSTGPAVSIVVPAHDEAGGIAALIAEIHGALAGGAYEIIVVDDGSRDATAAVAAAGGVRLLRHARRAGQSAAILTGVRGARADVVATIDGDGQNDPADLPGLFAALAAEPGVALVAGVRRGRRDGAFKRLASRIANGVRRGVLRDGAADTACGLKGFHRAAFLALPPFDHMHRFLPALFLAAGHGVRFRDVADRPRRGGRSKYGVLDRLWVGLGDLVGVFWLRRRLLIPPPMKETADGR